jgi:hypothetical protein
MKMIKEGFLPTNRKYHVSCTHCNSIFEYFHYEILEVSESQMEGITHYLGSCPFCDKALHNYTPKVL